MATRPRRACRWVVARLRDHAYVELPCEDDSPRKAQAFRDAARRQGMELDNIYVWAPSPTEPRVLVGTTRGALGGGLPAPPGGDPVVERAVRAAADERLGRLAVGYTAGGTAVVLVGALTLARWLGRRGREAEAEPEREPEREPQPHAKVQVIVPSTHPGARPTKEYDVALEKKELVKLSREFILTGERWPDSALYDRLQPLDLVLEQPQPEILIHTDLLPMRLLKDGTYNLQAIPVEEGEKKEYLDVVTPSLEGKVKAIYLVQNSEYPGHNCDFYQYSRNPKSATHQKPDIDGHYSWMQAARIISGLDMRVVKILYLSSQGLVFLMEEPEYSGPATPTWMQVMTPDKFEGYFKPSCDLWDPTGDQTYTLYSLDGYNRSMQLMVK